MLAKGEGVVVFAEGWTRSSGRLGDVGSVK